MRRPKPSTDFEPQLDLLEVRRQLLEMRSRHSDNRRVTLEINKLIGEIAHLRQPEDVAHEKQLTEMIAQTWRSVEVFRRKRR